jgi:heme oxygenase
MLPLKEAIQEKHTQAERMPFNARMFRGELSKKEYLFYLHQQASIFQCIEEHKIPQMHPKLKRLESVFADIQELQKEVTDKFPSLESTKKYGMYLESLTDDRILAHIYLNYLALMFGGQMMKSKVPGSGKMYEFENQMELVGSVRAFQKDEMGDEANKALDYNIAILDELQRVSESFSE